MLRENFQLKSDLVYEKKRYLDLMNAFMELRSQGKAEGKLSISPRFINRGGNNLGLPEEGT